MFQYEEEAAIGEDREDLIQLLTMRFGSMPPNVLEAIYQLNEFETIERLILVAANAPTLKTFLEELQEGQGNFKIVGERFNPIEYIQKSGDENEK
ncbi:hypothetical protein [Saliterribacillus persicus]|uniref:Uncharacterized protein n=1 Tax=Saliterribacillus persicus TaxID=930114 RepID=A0A368XLW2_9BACI|nr:hypothetical protein [Saliterribacillus persicus]RCW67024.1 hypothetical protein DFR57_108120 [Saliterribacillus persicus]